MKNLPAQNKKMPTLVGLLVAASCLAALPLASHAAAPRLDVEFESGSGPLFGETSFAPGAVKTAWVKVTNNTETTQRVMTESINASDGDGLGSKMTLVISGDASGEAYGGSFGEFLRAGEVELADLVPGASETYTYSVAFQPGTDNSYQDKTLSFDLCVGFRSESGGKRCGGTVIGGENDSGGGGGGGGSNLVLVIENERVQSIDSGAGSAVIAWDTNILSTSQVIYGPASGTYSLNLSQPFFGYPFGTTEIAAKVTGHSVLIAGLTPGAEYKYRVVSRASPPTVSYERTFVVPTAPFPAVTRAEPAGPIQAAGARTGGADGAGASSSPETAGTATTSAAGQEAAAGERPNPNLAAAFFGISGDFASMFTTIGGAIAILLALYLFLSQRKKRREQAD